MAAKRREKVGADGGEPDGPAEGKRPAAGSPDAADGAVDGRAPLPFDAELAELELVVRQLEEGQLGLEESLKQYERGVAALRRCHQRLAEAERRVELVTGAGKDGQPEVETFADPGLTLTEKAAQRDQRRSQPGGGGSPRASSADIDETDRLF